MNVHICRLIFILHTTFIAVSISFFIFGGGFCVLYINISSFFARKLLSIKHNQISVMRKRNSKKHLKEHTNYEE